MEEILTLKREDFTKENFIVLMNNHKSEKLFIIMIDDKEKIPVAMVNEIDDLFIANILSYNKDCKVLTSRSIIGNIMYLLFEKSFIDRLHLEHYRYLNKYKNRVNIENRVIDGVYLGTDSIQLDKIKIKENIVNDSLELDIYDKGNLVLNLKDILYIRENMKKELCITVLKYKENIAYTKQYYMSLREV